LSQLSSTQVYRWRYASFTEAVRELQQRWPFSVTSWWRTPTHNATLAGHVGNSEHLVGLAIDLVFDAGQVPDAGDFTAWCSANGIKAEDITAQTAAPAGPGETVERAHWHLEFTATL
jgi:hypothetical protein